VNLDATGLPIFLKEKNTELLKRKVFTKWVMDQVLNWKSTRTLDISEDTIFLRTIPTKAIGGWNIYNTSYIGIGKEERRTLTFPSAGVSFSWNQSYSRSDSRIKNLAKLSKNTRIIPEYVKKRETIFSIGYRVEFTPRKTTLSFFVRPGHIFRAGGSSTTFREESRGKIEESTLSDLAGKLRIQLIPYLEQDAYFWQSLPVFTVLRNAQPPAREIKVPTVKRWHRFLQAFFKEFKLDAFAILHPATARYAGERAFGSFIDVHGRDLDKVFLLKFMSKGPSGYRFTVPDWNSNDAILSFARLTYKALPAFTLRLKEFIANKWKYEPAFPIGSTVTYVYHRSNKESRPRYFGTVVDIGLQGDLLFQEFPHPDATTQPYSRYGGRRSPFRQVRFNSSAWPNPKAHPSWHLKEIEVVTDPLELIKKYKGNLRTQKYFSADRSRYGLNSNSMEKQLLEAWFRDQWVDHFVSGIHFLTQAKLFNRLYNPDSPKVQRNSVSDYMNRKDIAIEVFGTKKGLFFVSNFEFTCVSVRLRIVANKKGFQPFLTLNIKSNSKNQKIVSSLCEPFEFAWRGWRKELPVQPTMAKALREAGKGVENEMNWVDKPALLKGIPIWLLKEEALLKASGKSIPRQALFQKSEPWRDRNGQPFAELSASQWKQFLHSYFKKHYPKAKIFLRGKSSLDPFPGRVHLYANNDSARKAILKTFVNWEKRTLPITQITSVAKAKKSKGVREYFSVQPSGCKYRDPCTLIQRREAPQFTDALTAYLKEKVL
jgi:hypothetical protein